MGGSNINPRALPQYEPALAVGGAMSRERMDR